MPVTEKLLQSGCWSAMSWIRRRPVAVEGIEGGRRWGRKALLHGERICGEEPLLLEDAVDGLEEEEMQVGSAASKRGDSFVCREEGREREEAGSTCSALAATEREIRGKWRPVQESWVCVLLFLCKRGEAPVSFHGERSEKKNRGLSRIRLKIKPGGLPWFSDGGCPGKNEIRRGGLVWASGWIGFLGKGRLCMRGFRLGFSVFFLDVVKITPP